MWIHYAVLIGVVLGIESLRPDSVSLLGALYAWMPLVAGVAVAIQPANRRGVTSGLAVGCVSALLMVGLDIGGSFQAADRPNDAVFIEGEVQEGNPIAGVTTESWVRIGTDWLQGDLQGIDQSSESYSEEHPRLMALEALVEFALLLLCFTITGIVLGVCSWLGRHARFDSRANEAGARIATAWLVSAGVMLLSLAALASRRFDVLFGNAGLWTVLLPSFGFLALGAVGFWMAARSDEGRSAGRP